jgi:hypothetical protein
MSLNLKFLIFILKIQQINMYHFQNNLNICSSKINLFLVLLIFFLLI